MSCSRRSLDSSCGRALRRRLLGTILARQARVSSFWDELGGNPILRHHAYLAGNAPVMLPFHLASKAVFGFFDPRCVTLLF